MRPLSRWIVLPLLLLVAPLALRAAEPPAPAARLIEQFKMVKIPDEGCWFVQTYRSAETIPSKDLPARYGGTEHSTGTAIYALETRAGFSALHVLNTDEVYHWYGGSAMEMLLLYPDGHGETLVLGPDLSKGERPQIVIPHGVWQGSRPVEAAGPDAYTFFGTTVSPGFEYGDFRMGSRAELLKTYPKFTAQITALTREAK